MALNSPRICGMSYDMSHLNDSFIQADFCAAWHIAFNKKLLSLAEFDAVMYHIQACSLQT